MDAEDLLETIREDQRTPLSRLGSSKALYALTEGEMDDDAVRAAIADVAHHAAKTFAGWGGDVAEDAAATARDHREEIGDDYEPGEPSAMDDALAGFDGDAARLGGILGWTLVAENYAEQATGYFTGQADPRTASTFRSLGDDLADLRDGVLDALEGIDDRGAAETAAAAVVEAAYDGYVDTLESLGVNPKPVC